MLAAMQTINANDLVSAMFEACSGFAPGADGSPVCSACGWLDAEHAAEIAEVRTLPARTRPVAVPKRIAS
jgi:hypothetical protein